MSTRFAMAIVAVLVASFAFQNSAHAYGAIAYSAYGPEWGIWANKPSQAAANKAALADCGLSTCKLVKQFRKSCAAVVLGNNNNVKWSVASTLAAAKASALKDCGGSKSHCTVKASYCDK